MNDLLLILNVLLPLGMAYIGWFVAFRMPKRMLGGGGERDEKMKATLNQAMHAERDRLLKKQEQGALSQKEREQLAEVQLWIASGGRSGGLEGSNLIGPMGTAVRSLRWLGLLLMLGGLAWLLYAAEPLLRS